MTKWQQLYNGEVVACKEMDLEQSAAMQEASWPGRCRRRRCRLRCRCCCGCRCWH